MSRSEGRPTPAAAARFLGSELGLVLRRRRNQALLIVLGLAPLLLAVALKLSPPGQPGEGPAFLDRITGNGLFLVFTALVVTLPVFLPLAVSVVAGDAVAGEASTGTLRYLLTVPVGRTRLLVTKWLAAVVFTAAAVAVVALVGLAAGAIFFPIGPMTLLSGDTVPLANGLVRALGVAAYVLLSLTGLVTVGLFFSTLTETPVVAMALTLGFVIVTAVLDSIPQLHAIQPGLLTHHWLDFGELLRPAPRLGTLLSGLGVQAAYVVVAGSLAWARLTASDVTS